MSSDNSMVIAIAEMDKPNLIGNIYTEEAITQMYEKSRELIKCGFLGGELVHSTENTHSKRLDLSRITHHVSNVDIVDRFLIAEISFANSTEGSCARSILEVGLGILRPTITGAIDPITKNVSVSSVISFDIIPYHEDFRIDITWKAIK